MLYETTGTLLHIDFQNRSALILSTGSPSLQFVRLLRVKIIIKLVLVGLIYYLVLVIFACCCAMCLCKMWM